MNSLFFIAFNLFLKSSVNAVCTEGWTTAGSGIESRYDQELTLLHIVQTGSEAHPTSYQMGTGGRGFSPGLKRQGHEADHSLTSI
jgi:hypothetical protein